MTAATTKIFGERNTGTNALKQLIELNSSSVCLPGTEDELRPWAARIASSRFAPGRVGETLKELIFLTRSPLLSWKHCATNFRTTEPFQGVFVLFTVRHPGSWVGSLFRHPYHRLGPAAPDLRTFISRPWQTVGRERLGGRSFYPLELYMAKFRSMMEFAARLTEAGVPNVVIRQEDLAVDQEAVFRRLCSCLTDPRNHVLPVKVATKNSARSVEELKAYYSAEQWRTPLRGLEGEINRQVDWKAVELIGYKPLS